MSFLCTGDRRLARALYTALLSFPVATTRDAAALELLADLKHWTAVMADPDRRSDGPSGNLPEVEDRPRPSSAAARRDESQPDGQTVRQNRKLTRSGSSGHGSCGALNTSDSQTKVADRAPPSNDTDSHVDESHADSERLDDSSEDNRPSSQRLMISQKGSRPAGPPRTATPAQAATAAADRALVGVRQLRSKETQTDDDDDARGQSESGVHLLLRTYECYYV